MCSVTKSRQGGVHPMRRRRTFGLAAFGAAAALMLAACSSGGSSSSSSGGGTGSAASPAYGAGITSVVNPSTHKGGTLTFDWRQRARLVRPGQHLLRVGVGLRPVLLDGADDLQELPGHLRQDGRPRPGHRPGRGQRQRADLDLSHQVRGQVPGRDPGHLPGRQVRGRAHLRPRRAVQRPELLPDAAGRERGQLPGAVQGPVQEPDGPDRDQPRPTARRSCSTWRSRSRTWTTC